MHDAYFTPIGMCAGTRDLFKFWEISGETLQDVDAQCNKLATVVGRQFITRAALVMRVY